MVIYSCIALSKSCPHKHHHHHGSSSRRLLKKKNVSPTALGNNESTSTPFSYHRVLIIKLKELFVDTVE